MRVVPKKPSTTSFHWLSLLCRHCLLYANRGSIAQKWQDLATGARLFLQSTTVQQDLWWEHDRRTNPSAICILLAFLRAHTEEVQATQHTDMQHTLTPKN